MAHQNTDAQRLGLFDQTAIFGQHPRIQNDRHIEPRMFQRDGGQICVVVVGDHHSAVANGHTIVHRIVAHRSGQHDARNIVPGKAEGSFDGPGGRDDLRRTDAPQAVTGTVSLRLMIVQPFIGQRITVIVHPCPHGAQAHVDIVHRGQFINRLVDVILNRSAVDVAAVHRCAAAPMVGLFDQNDPRARLARRACGLKARHAATDNHHIAEGIEMFIGVHVTGLGRLAQTGGFADDRFIDMFPRGAGVHEHLVIEPRRQKPAKMFVDRAYVKFKAWPVVLARRCQTLKDLGCRHPLVRLKPALFAKVNQGVGFLGTRGHDAARAVVFERAPHQHLVIGQQSGGQCVALIAAHLFAVEGKGYRLGLVQQAAACGKTCAHLRGSLVG